MKAEAVKKIRESMIPRVTFESAHDVAGGIDFELRLEYVMHYPGYSSPGKIGKTIRGHADKDGNILSCEGLF